MIAEVGDDQALPDRPASVRLGRAHPDRPQLRRQSPPRAHLPPRLPRAALGARRSRAEEHHRRRPAARRVRADRQTPRPQDRQGRGRPPDPHPLLLRPARRRDPLPGAPQPDEREREAGGGDMTAAAHAHRSVGLALPTAARCARSGELACCHGLATTRTAAHLIEPPSTARHSGPPRATGWMTGAPPPPTGSPSANRHPTTRAP